MINLAQHKLELSDRLDAATLLVDETHPHRAGSYVLPGPASREARGLVIVMLFASYENLLKSTTRTILEGAIACKVSNRRLQPGILTFALANTAKSMRDRSVKRLYSDSLPDLIDKYEATRGSCSIDPGSFPDDGSFMKKSQVILWCRLFNVGPPHKLLPRTWVSLDAIVSRRNDIAHGKQTAGDVGRSYTESDIRDLLADWRSDWTDFLTHIEQLASSRDFFRRP